MISDFTGSRKESEGGRRGGFGKEEQEEVSACVTVGGAPHVIKGGQSLSDGSTALVDVH